MAWHIHTVFNTFICYFVASRVLILFLFHLLFASSMRRFEQRQTQTQSHSLKRKARRKKSSKPKCRPAFKMNSVIHSLFHIILPYIRYTILILCSVEWVLYDVYVMCVGLCVMCIQRAYYYSCSDNNFTLKNKLY